MSSRQSRRSRRKNRTFVPITTLGGDSTKETCWCEDEELLDGYGLSGTPHPGIETLDHDIDTGPVSPLDDPTNFIEDCILVASSSPQAGAGACIHKSLELVAEAFWPDLVAGAHTWFDGETKEIVVETRTTAFRITVREVSRSAAHHRAVFEDDLRRASPVR